MRVGEMLLVFSHPVESTDLSARLFPRYSSAHMLHVSASEHCEKKCVICGSHHPIDGPSHRSIPRSNCGRTELSKIFHNLGIYQNGWRAHAHVWLDGSTVCLGICAFQFGKCIFWGSAKISRKIINLNTDESFIILYKFVSNKSSNISCILMNGITMTLSVSLSLFLSLNAALNFHFEW